MQLLRSPLFVLLGLQLARFPGCVHCAATVPVPQQVQKWQDQGIFIIQSESTKNCIQTDKSVLTLQNCNQPNKYMLWKWVSNHQLFNIGSSGCLGMDFSKPKPEQSLSIYECDSSHISLKWHCNKKIIVNTLFQYMIQAKEDNMVVASLEDRHNWVSYMSNSGDICEYLNKDVYSIKGNAHGSPCVFPFQYNHQWYHECIREGRKDKLLWCATTSRFERDEKWGFCPDSTSMEVLCDTVWEKDNNSHICYQFNLLSSLSWSEAHSSCYMQGESLLSIEDETEENFIRKHLGNETVEVWMGLNQLDEDAGWQWSDKAPLSYMNWNLEVNFDPFIEYNCGTFSSFLPNAWRSRNCESTLPYVCKKYLKTHHETSEKDVWKYHATQCEPGWNPYNHNCYKLQKEEKNWHEALYSCQTNSSMLIDITSLAEVEFLINLLEDENGSETWIGLHNSKIPVSFQWSSGSPVTFTNWHTLEPKIFPNRKQLCVSADQTGYWKIKHCEENLYYICKKPGLVLSDADSGCQEGWKRHGKFCYKIDTALRSFDHASSGYYCPPALVTITNRFEQAFITSLISNIVTTGDSYFWIALQDQNNTGEYTWKTTGWKSEPVRYTHWNAHQPRSSGGCVVMRGSSSPGFWEVKDCRNFKAMSVCKQPVKYQKKPEVELKLPFYPCYLDWESEPGLDNCFKVFHSEKILMKRTWREAEAFCEEFGAHLASFAHVEEENFVNKLLHLRFNRTEERLFWIGFNKRNPLSAGSWKWSDGTPVVSSFLDNSNFEEDARNCAVYKANKTLLPMHCGSKREWICKLPRDVNPNIPSWYQHDAPWLFHHDAEYFFYTYAAKWHSAEFACAWMKSEILTINSANEQEFIHSQIKALSQNGANWWLGLQGESTNDGFRIWKDGSPVIYQNWDKGREEVMHKHNQKKRCGFISSVTGLWATEDCSVPMSSICKRKEIWTFEKQKPERKHGSCPKEWLYFNFKCFLVNIPKDPSDSKNWMSAQDFCVKEDGTLVSIENEIEQAFITMKLFGQTTDMWIGLKSNDYEKWLSGKPVTYSNWSPSDVIKIPSQNTTGVQNHILLCALLSMNPNFYFTGKWYFGDCGKEGYGFVCEKMPDTSGHDVHISNMYLIPKTLEFGNRTYKIINKTMTWYTAVKACLMHGAELVSITDQYHQSFLTVILNQLGHAHWIGLFTADNGINFDWSDGTKFSFTFWKDDESPFLGDCVFADTNGRWSSTACDSFLQGAICHVPTETRPTGYPDLCSETSIPWVKFKNNCYSFSTILDSTSFEAAQEFCKKEGSNLLTIKDKDENLFLLEELSTLGSNVQMVWLNALFDDDYETITWFDGTPTNLSNWHIRKPEVDYIKSHPCIALKIPEGVWQLSPCEEKKGFICKMKADIHTVKEQASKGPSHSIVPLTVALTVIVVLGISTLIFYIYKHRTGIFRRFAVIGNSYYSTTNISTLNLEENILISDLEKNDQ